MLQNQINMSIRRRYKKYSDEEKRNYYQTFIKSGMNSTDFCKANGISKSALYQWSKQFQCEHHDVDFSPLVIKSTSPNSSLTNPSLKPTDMVQLTVVFNNSPVQLNVSIHTHHLVLFIQEIGHATSIVR
jgi:transposase-like protein